MEIILANSFLKRLIGFSFKKKVDYILLFRNCKGVHTFFMKFNVDLIMTDQNNHFLYCFKEISKNKIIYKKDAFFIYEIPSFFNYKIEDIINRGTQIHNQESELNHRL